MDCSGPISPKRQSNGLVLMTYYNDGGFGAFASHMAINDRNNMWLTVGHEQSDGTLHWTQPELALYDTVRSNGHGYPDIVSAKDGHVYLTETFKNTPGARAGVHKLDARMLELLFGQHNTTRLSIAADTFAFAAPKKQPPAGPSFLQLPTSQFFPDFNNYTANRDGMTLELRMTTPQGGKDNEILFASHDVDPAGDQLSGMQLKQSVAGNVTVEILSSSGQAVSWTTDPTCSAQLGTPGEHYFAMVIDVGPGMVLFFVDGKLCDGGIAQRTEKQWAAGWRLLPYGLGKIRGNEQVCHNHISLWVQHFLALQRL